MSFWVYILECSDGSYYTGHADDLDVRLDQHASGQLPECYTYARRPFALAYSQAFETRLEALTAERKIKGWSRKKKSAMILGDWSEVTRLAQSRTVPTPSKQTNRPQQPATIPSRIRTSPTGGI